MAAQVPMPGLGGGAQFPPRAPRANKCYAGVGPSRKSTVNRLWRSFSTGFTDLLKRSFAGACFCKDGSTPYYNREPNGEEHGKLVGN